MIGQKLRIEQGEPAMIEPGGEIDQCNLAGVTLARKHAFAEKRTGDPDPVESAHQGAIAPDLNGMAVAEVEQLAVERANALVDPGAVAPGMRLRAAIYDRLEIVIDAHLEALLADGAGKPL